MASRCEDAEGGMVDCSSCGLRQPRRREVVGNYEMAKNFSLKTLEVFEGFDASKHVETSEGFDASKTVVVLEPLAVAGGRSDVGVSHEHGDQCGFCGERLDLLDSQENVIPGEHTEPLPRFSWTDVERFHEMELEEHRALKSMWMEEHREVARGEEEGREQGQHLEMIMEELLMKEEDLEEQHRVLERHRLASLVQTSMDSQQEPPCTVLQTYTVPLQQVRKELALWKQPLLDEYRSLTETPGALKVTTEKELRRDPCFPQMEVVPAMSVPTVKAPHGKQRARIVICGNRIGAKKTDSQQVTEGFHGGPGDSLFANYAGGADGVLLRAMLRKTGAKKWHCATVDVKTAFLLAPRREAESKLMRPPKILQEAGIVGPDEWWEVENAWFDIKPFQLDQL